MNHHLHKVFLSITLVSFLILSACSESAPASPTESISNIFTEAAQTVTAQATLPPIPFVTTSAPAATTPPIPAVTALATFTPLVIVTATDSSSSGSSSSQGACDDNSAYVSDVTIPDHTVMAPGATFQKTWALQNTGTCVWSSTYTISFVSGDQMGGNTTPIGQTVQPQGNANISVSLTAPTTEGEYTGYWQLTNDQGTQFGESIYVLIDVAAGGTQTSGNSPVETVTPQPTSGQ